MQEGHSIKMTIHGLAAGGWELQPITTQKRIRLKKKGNSLQNVPFIFSRILIFKSYAASFGAFQRSTVYIKRITIGNHIRCVAVI